MKSMMELGWGQDGVGYNTEPRRGVIVVTTSPRCAIAPLGHHTFTLHTFTMRPFGLHRRYLMQKSNLRGRLLFWCMIYC